MKQILNLQGVTFDPFTQKITLSTNTHIADLYDLTVEAFKHSELITTPLPMEMLSTPEAVFYTIKDWKIEGARVLVDPIAGVLYALMWV